MKTLLSVSILSLAIVAGAQDRDPIATDRPDFTESAIVVPFKSVQLETGFTYQWSKQAFGFGGPEALFRISMGQRSEFRIALPDYNWQRAGGVSSTGFGDTYVGAKIQLGPLKNGDDLAIIPALTLPSRDTNFSSRTVDPEVKICWGRDIGHEWGVSAMAYGLYTNDSQGRLFVYQQTVSFGRGLSDRLAMFTEYAGTFSGRSIPDHVLHVGLVYQASNNSQFDLHGGFSMNGPDRQPFIAAGYSVRY